MNATPLQDAEKSLEKAMKLELSGDYDRAFKTYVAAAQAFIAVKKSLTDSSTAQRSKTQAAKCLDRAEKLKKLRPALRAPIKSILDPAEQSRILEASSTVSGVYYRPWTAELPDELQDSIFSDAFFPTEISITDNLRWMRAADLGLRPLTDPGSVAQSTLSDCSVVASMLACIAHNRQYSTSLAWSAVHPHTTLASSGKYRVKLLWNGSYKEIAVDDKFPVLQDGRLASASSTNDALWVPILEKACMKLHGRGYNFHGSDPGFDLWTMTGWIPDVISLESSKMEATWRRLFEAFSNGHCLLTAGTGDNADSQHGLIPKHAYVISQLQSADSVRQVELLNPWTREGSAASSTIRLSWEVFYAKFKDVYANWNPETLFGNSEPNQTVHFSIKNETDATFKIEAAGDTEVWLVLLRHVCSDSWEDAFISLSASRGQASPDLREMTPSSFTSRSYYTVKLPCRTSTLSPWEVYTSVRGATKEHNCSLFVYSQQSVAISEVPDLLRYKDELSGEWTPSVGGHHTSPTFYTNPQYLLTFDNKTTPATLDLKLQGAVDQSMNIKVLRGTERVSDLTISDIVADASAYTYAVSRLKAAHLKASSYVLVCSNYAPNAYTGFKLLARSDQPFTIKPLPTEGAGMFRQDVQEICLPTARRSFWLKNQSSFDITARLQLQTDDASSSRPKIDVFRAGDNSPLASSGTTPNATAGAFLKLSRLGASENGHILTVSFASHVGAAPFRLHLFTSIKADVQPLS